MGQEKHGTPLFDANTIARFLCDKSGDAARKALLGKTEAEKAEVGGRPFVALSCLHTRVDHSVMLRGGQVLGWMSMASKSDDPEFQEFYPANARMQLTGHFDNRLGRPLSYHK